jgi:predicted ATP-grasp superfamily ATP-dependent carboligase
MVEEFVDGPVCCTEILYHKGKPLCWNSCLALQHWPTPLAASCLRQTVDHPDIERIVRTVGEMTGFSGFCGADWILDRRVGHPFLIEFNPRATPGLHLGYTAKVDFARALAAMLRGVPTMQAPSVPGGTGLVSAMFPELAFRAIDDRAPLVLLKAMRQMPADDPMLALAHIRRIITHYLPRRIRSSGRGVRRLRGEA